MAQTLSMVSHKNYDLGANEGFDFQINYMVYWQFDFENEIPTNCLLLNGCEHKYWIWDLEGAVHSIWALWISGLQECKSNDFFEVGRAGSSFWPGSENLDFLDRRLPLLESFSPEKFVCVCGGLTSSLFYFGCGYKHLRATLSLGLN